MAKRQGQHRLQPAQVILPQLIGDFVQRLPIRRAKARLVIGPIGQRGDAEAWAWQRLGRAQHLHLGIGHPGAFLARLAVIEHGDIVDAAQLERAGGGDAIHACPHHQHIQRAILARRQPGLCRQAEHVEVSPDGRLMRREADAGGCVHAVRQSVIAGGGCPRGARLADQSPRAAARPARISGIRRVAASCRSA